MRSIPPAACGVVLSAGSQQGAADAYQRSTHLSLREAQGRGLPDREHQVAAQLHRLLHVHLRAVRSPVWRIVQDGFNSFHTRKVD